MIQKYLITVFTLSILLTSCINKSSVMNDSTSMDIEIIQQAFEKWQSGEKNFFDLLDNDVEWTVSGRSPVSGIYHGKDDFINRALNPITGRFKTPLKPELISLTTDGKFVWLHFHGKAIGINGKDYENTYLWKMQLTNGKITKGVAFLDTYELARLMTIQKE